MRKERKEDRERKEGRKKERKKRKEKEKRRKRKLLPILEETQPGVWNLLDSKDAEDEDNAI